MRIIPGFYSDQSENLTQAWPGSGHVMMRHECCEWEAESSEGQGRGWQGCPGWVLWVLGLYPLMGQKSSQDHIRQGSSVPFYTQK